MSDLVDTSSLEFPQFNKFPREIRLATWKLAIPEPRIVHLKHSRMRADDDDWRFQVRSDGEIPPPHGKSADHEHEGHAVDPWSRWGFKSDSQIPSLLLVCRESFLAVSQSYSLTFSGTRAIPQTYFDFRRDTLYLNVDSLDSSCEGGYSSGNPLATITAKHLNEADVARVEHLAIDPTAITTFLHPLELDQWVTDTILPFSNLKTLSVVLGHYPFGSIVDGSPYGIEKQYNDLKVLDLKIYETPYGRICGTSQNIVIPNEILGQCGYFRPLMKNDLQDSLRQRHGDWFSAFPARKCLLNGPDVEHLFIAPAGAEAEIFRDSYEVEGLWAPVPPEVPRDYFAPTAAEVRRLLEVLRSDFPWAVDNSKVPGYLLKDPHADPVRNVITTMGSLARDIGSLVCVLASGRS